jgi:hypothetical protein
MASMVNLVVIGRVKTRIITTMESIMKYLHAIPSAVRFSLAMSGGVATRPRNALRCGTRPEARFCRAFARGVGLPGFCTHRVACHSEPPSAAG